MMRRGTLLAGLVWGFLLPAAHAADHGPWDALLKQFVAEGRVDYVGFAAQRASLEAYLSGLGAVDPAALGSPQEALAFWINAYNACVIQEVLDRYPLRSVKDVRGFFDRERCRVGGGALTLNEIEAKGRALGDWRIHFGLVCGSTSCPPLRPEAYQAARVSEQLDDQAARFLNDPVHGFRVDGNVMWVSKIFKWYANDFVPSGSLTPASLWPLIDRYVTREESLFADPTRLTLKFLDYDWTLNDQTRPGATTR
jgi:hypothetical protein